MNRKCSWLVFVVLALTLAVAFNGCSGGGSSSSTPTTTTTGTGSTLKVAEKVSVVDAQSTVGKPVALKIGDFRLAPASGSDYYNDPQTIWVEEGSAEAFDTINEILCSMTQAQYDDMVNKGDYKAQIDKSKCSSNSDSAKSAGQNSQNQSSGSTATSYEMWTVNSNRADNNSPHYVKVWIHQDADEMGKEMLLYAKATITESVSSTNPYGIFTIYFKSEATVNGATFNPFKGFLKAEKDSTGKVLLKFANKGGFDMDNDGTNDFGFDEGVTMDRASDGSSGTGTTYMSNNMGTESKSGQYDFAFTTANFRRRDASDTTKDKCYSRTTFDETVWRYGLYDATTGVRTEIDSGFPIKKDSSYGWIGYYGLWFPEDVTINDGDTVKKVTYSQSGETTTDYTVVKKGGKLKKNTKHTTTLSDIKGIPLDFFNESDTGDYRVKWDSTQQKFIIFSKMNQTTFMWENVTESALNLATAFPYFGDMNFWSQAIGGQVRVKRTCTGFDQITDKMTCTDPTNASSVIYFTEDVVYAGDTVPSSLTCYDNCPKYDATLGVTQQQSDYDPSDGTTSYTYAFSSSASDMLLKDSSGNSLVLTSASGTQQWGFMSGPLFEPTSANLAALACDDWNQNSQADEGTCGWKAWSELSEYYTWETGTDSWNQLTILKDSSGTALKFDPPIQVLYAHSQTDSTKGDYKYNGTKFYLEYSGFGNLWGIPGKCVDFDTGADTSCGPKTRWIPEFSIADGSDMTKSDDSTKKYASKALEKEQRMSNVADSNCSSLTLTSYTLPSISDWVDPNIGTEPTVTNAPAVVGGVLQ